jgi:thymidylate kinase
MKEPERTFIFVRYLLGTAYLPAPLAPSGYRFFRKLLPFPDLAIFIDIDPEVAARRIQARGFVPEMFETRERMESLRRVVRHLVSEEWVTVDNSTDGEPPFLETERVVSQTILGVPKPSP